MEWVFFASGFIGLAQILIWVAIAFAAITLIYQTSVVLNGTTEDEVPVILWGRRWKALVLVLVIIAALMLPSFASKNQPRSGHRNNVPAITIEEPVTPVLVVDTVQEEKEGALEKEQKTNQDFLDRFNSLPNAK